MRPIALILLPLVLALPIASANAPADELCIIFFEPSKDFRLVDVRADLILTPDERANLSALVDADADGTITPAEVATYENNSVTIVTQREDYGERLLYMDGNLPTQMTVWTKLRNWTGPVEEARKGVVTELREYHTVPKVDKGHILTGGLYAAPHTLQQRRPVIETIVVSAPEGWVVFEVGHLPPHPTPDEQGRVPPSSMYTQNQRFEQKSVTLSQFDIRSQYEVVFAKEGENPYDPNGSPGVGAVAVLATLAAVAFAMHARRP